MRAARGSSTEGTTCSCTSSPGVSARGAAHSRRLAHSLINGRGGRERGAAAAAVVRHRELAARLSSWPVTYRAHCFWALRLFLHAVPATQPRAPALPWSPRPHATTEPPARHPPSFRRPAPGALPIPTTHSIAPTKPHPPHPNPPRLLHQHDQPQVPHHRAAAGRPLPHLLLCLVHPLLPHRQVSAGIRVCPPCSLCVSAVRVQVGASESRGAALRPRNAQRVRSIVPCSSRLHRHERVNSWAAGERSGASSPYPTSPAGAAQVLPGLHLRCHHLCGGLDVWSHHLDHHRSVGAQPASASGGG